MAVVLLFMMRLYHIPQAREGLAASWGWYREAARASRQVGPPNHPAPPTWCKALAALHILAALHMWYNLIVSICAMGREEEQRQ